MLALTKLPQTLRIGVIRGGSSGNYDDSVKNGAHVLRQLGETHKPIDVFISHDGKWHIQGVERPPEKILKHVDVLWNSLYDGGVEVMELVGSHGIPFTGAGRYETAIANNRLMAKERAIKAGIKTPIFITVKSGDSVYEKSKEIFSSMPHPLRIAPVSGGNMQVIGSFNELVEALDTILSNYPSAIVEEYISGEEASCIVLDNFRNEEYYVFPPISNKNSLKRDVIELLESISKKIHQVLDLSRFSKSDFTVNPRRGIYFHEVSTMPKFGEDSQLSRSLENVGVSNKEFLHHMISLAFQ